MDPVRDRPPARRGADRHHRPAVLRRLGVVLERAARRGRSVRGPRSARPTALARRRSAPRPGRRGALVRGASAGARPPLPPARFRPLGRRTAADRAGAAATDGRCRTRAVPQPPLRSGAVGLRGRSAGSAHGRPQRRTRGASPHRPGRVPGHRPARARARAQPGCRPDVRGSGAHGGVHPGRGRGRALVRDGGQCPARAGGGVRPAGGRSADGERGAAGGAGPLPGVPGRRPGRFRDCGRGRAGENPREYADPVAPSTATAAPGSRLPAGGPARLRAVVRAELPRGSRYRPGRHGRADRAEPGGMAAGVGPGPGRLDRCGHRRTGGGGRGGWAVASGPAGPGRGGTGSVRARPGPEGPRGPPC